MEYRVYHTACSCACHNHSGIDNPESVDVRDVVEAALACDTCRYLHCPALRDPEPPPVIHPPKPFEFCAPPDEGEGSET